MIGARRKLYNLLHVCANSSDRCCVFSFPSPEGEGARRAGEVICVVLGYSPKSKTPS